MSRITLLIVVSACGRIGFDPHDGGAVDSDAVIGVDAAEPNNIVFVTSTLISPGSLGGLQGADTVCAQRAIAGGLAGHYVAWLSTTTVNAKDRLAGARGWVRRDGRPFVDTVDDLINGRILYPVRFDESGQDAVQSADASAATGTDSLGNATAFTCVDWTATGPSVSGGRSDATYVSWTSNTSASCAQPLRLYCFGTDSQAPLISQPVVGRRAFLSTMVPAPLGLTGADANCQADADANALGGTFRAWLPTTTATAGSRFTATGAPWVRLDGAPLGASNVEVLAGSWLTSLHVQADRTPAFHNVWFGADDPAAVATTSNCADWSTRQPSSMAVYGSSVYSSALATNFNFSGCDASFGIYCFEP